ncbi:MAG TPA: primosomal protein N' [Bacteroidales bacterium]|nr:primosomal protein N' [Bacteroidales bacterium]
MVHTIKTGMRVTVPLGLKKNYTAIVSELTEKDINNDIQYKEIKNILDTTPIANNTQLRFWQWMAEYYMCSEGEIYRAAIPAGLKPDNKHYGYKPKTEIRIRIAQQYQNEQELQKALNSLKKAPAQQQLLLNIIYLTTQDYKQFDDIKRAELLNARQNSATTLNTLIEKGFIVAFEQQVSRIENNNTKKYDESKENINLSEHQQAAYDTINKLWQTKNVVLLHGVTSSGKTEIYSQIIKDVINSDGQVLFLVPEIALTTQLTERMKKILGENLGIYHSGFSDEERVEVYRKQLSDNPFKVIMGARSAIFLPMTQLKLVIVDEEHESSYKQQNPAPRYHARNAAIMLAQIANAKVLLGSATPAVETYYNATIGKYGLVTLTHRYGDVQMPDIEIIDIKECRRKKMYDGPFMDPLTDKIKHTLNENKQVILFQNRRGLAHYITCEDCAVSPTCPNCEVSLTPHIIRGNKFLSCHYCGYSTGMPDKCPECGSIKLTTTGIGTEKVQQETQKLFNGARVARLDTDTTRRKNAHQHIISDFAQHNNDILIGTQMVSKGLDFNNVALVAVLNADSLLTLPDFRSTERAYQLLEQVSGRAGRRQQQGTVIIQTYNTQHPIMQWVKEHDYLSFYNYTIKERQLLRYPPFVRMYTIVFKHKEKDIALHAAQYAQQILAKYFPQETSNVTEPLVSRIMNIYYQTIVLRIDNKVNIHQTRQIINYAIQQTTAQNMFKTAQFYVEID